MSVGGRQLCWKQGQKILDSMQYGGSYARVGRCRVYFDQACYQDYTKDEQEQLVNLFEQVCGDFIKLFIYYYYYQCIPC